MEGVDENKEAAIILDKNYKLYSYEEIKALVDKTILFISSSVRYSLISSLTGPPLPTV